VVIPSSKRVLAFQARTLFYFQSISRTNCNRPKQAKPEQKTRLDGQAKKKRKNKQPSDCDSIVAIAFGGLPGFFLVAGQG
jgi:hypothetical protein